MQSGWKMREYCALRSTGGGQKLHITTAPTSPSFGVSVRTSTWAWISCSLLVWKTSKCYWWGFTKPKPWLSQFISLKKKNKYNSSVKGEYTFVTRKSGNKAGNTKKGSILRRWDNSFNNLIENQYFCHYRTRAFQLIYCELIGLLILWHCVNSFHAFGVIVLNKLYLSSCILRENRG